LEWLYLRGAAKVWEERVADRAQDIGCVCMATFGAAHSERADGLAQRKRRNFSRAVGVALMPTARQSAHPAQARIS
jgi:hypothetical protein